MQVLLLPVALENTEPLEIVDGLDVAVDQVCHLVFLMQQLNQEVLDSDEKIGLNLIAVEQGDRIVDLKNTPVKNIAERVLFRVQGCFHLSRETHGFEHKY